MSMSKLLLNPITNYCCHL